MSADTEVLCEVTEAFCVCELPVDHEPPHECRAERCGGKWTYDEGGNFVPVVWPDISRALTFGADGPLLFGAET